MLRGEAVPFASTMLALKVAFWRGDPSWYTAGIVIVSFRLRDNVDNAWMFKATLAGISLKLEDTNGCP
jgi:hypothetical protein